MRTALCLVWPWLLFAACGSVVAAPLLGPDDLRRNGALSRHLWTPDAGRAEVLGLGVSAGLAVGVFPGLRSAAGGRVSPAVTLQLDRRSSLTLLASGRGGFALAWSVAN